jgi:uncharacterized protein
MQSTKFSSDCIWRRFGDGSKLNLVRSPELICRYPTREEGDKKGILLIVTSGKDGALSGGPAFMSAVGDEFIDSIISENIPIFTQEEKYNECLTSSVKRIEAVLTGAEDPGPPIRCD